MILENMTLKDALKILESKVITSIGKKENDCITSFGSNSHIEWTFMQNNRMVVVMAGWTLRKALKSLRELLQFHIKTDGDIKNAIKQMPTIEQPLKLKCGKWLWVDLEEDVYNAYSSPNNPQSPEGLYNKPHRHILDGKCWVTCTDTSSRGHITKMVCQCSSYKHAALVQDMWSSHSHHKQVNIRTSKPRYPKGYRVNMFIHDGHGVVWK